MQAGKTIFVTRHSGAREWLQTQAPDLVAVAEFVDHLPADRIATLSPGDTMVGTLPVNLIAAVNARGARYLHLSLDLPPDARGKNLSAEEMRRFGARLEPFFSLALSQRKLPHVVSEASPTGETARGRARRRHTQRLQLLGLFLVLLAALSGGFATNILTPAITSWLQPDSGQASPNLWVLFAGVMFIVGLVLFTWLLFLLRNSLFSHAIVARRDRVQKPCRVLVTALSNDPIDRPSQDARDPADPVVPRLLGDLLLEAIQNDPTLDLNFVGRPRAELEGDWLSRGSVPSWAAINWLTNLRAIAALAAKLETIVIVPSKDAKIPHRDPERRKRGEIETVKGSSRRVDTFARAVQILWARSCGSTRHLRIVSLQQSCDYENYQEVMDGIEEAIERAGEVGDDEICIDITSGTKPISVAGAVSTMNGEKTFIYITNERHFWTFNARISLGEALS